MVLLLFAGLLVAVVVAGRGTFGTVEDRGTPAGNARSPESLREGERTQAAAARAVGREDGRQILFGDLHVHTTFSADAFTFSLPMVGGEGGHPPSDACDFARHCAALDFFSINDHAGNLSERRWVETVEAIRQCNAVSGASDDLVAFLGWEWTQAGPTRETHFGHKNVILRDTEDGDIPTRPIAATKNAGENVGELGLLPRGAAALLMGGRFHDWAAYLTETEAIRDCPTGVSVRDLPTDCREAVATPAELFEKLDDWGYPSLVIPHGTSWGAYTPAGASWDKQLVDGNHDPARQTLIEVYSGHGDSEVYRDWRAVDLGPDGTVICPSPRPNYLPSCWRAGQIIEARCLNEGTDATICEERAALARARHLEGGMAGHLVVPGVLPEDWLDAGQCQDCREPSFNYRPASSAQYILALGDFSEPGPPARFRMGLMASSDNHFARSGSGYKEVARRGMTESMASGPVDESLGVLSSVILPPPSEPLPNSIPFAEAIETASGFQRFEAERASSFLITGGLIAVHAEGRDRDAVWDGMQRREVYGTSGPRILLWFDWLEADGRRLPMGSEGLSSRNPRFEVRAVGSLVQKPGCPEESLSSLGAADVARLCKGECYYPTDERRPLSRIEVVRIRPQIKAGEPIGELIEDPWRVFPCSGDRAGCMATFEDPEFRESGREAVYYVRAFEEPMPGINADNLRCERDEAGACIHVSTCPQSTGDECLAPHEPRAWSSPIFISQP